MLSSFSQVTDRNSYKVRDGRFPSHFSGGVPNVYARNVAENDDDQVNHLRKRLIGVPPTKPLIAFHDQLFYGDNSLKAVPWPLPF